MTDLEATRALMRRALTEPDWNQSDSIPALVEIDAALAELADQKALKHTEPGLDGQMARTVENDLRVIGAAIDPRMSADQAKAWRKAVLLKLSNLPGPVAIRAVRKALHLSFAFFGDVEPAIRKLGEEGLQKQKVAAMRLKRWRVEIERAAAPQPALPPPAEPATQEEVDALNADMAAAGFATRWKLEAGEVVIATPPSDKRRNENG